jgi:hypothetical protein
VPIIRYIGLVGSLLLGLLFLLGDRDPPVISPAPDRWTSVDSLRAMAHLGEPVQGRADNDRLVRAEKPWSASANPAELAEIAARENPLIMNAQANMDPRRAAAMPKPGKARIAARQVRVRTAVAEDAPRTSMEMFRPPSW